MSDLLALRIRMPHTINRDRVIFELSVAGHARGQNALAQLEDELHRIVAEETAPLAEALHDFALMAQAQKALLVGWDGATAEQRAEWVRMAECLAELTEKYLARKEDSTDV